MATVSPAGRVLATDAEIQVGPGLEALDLEILWWQIVAGTNDSVRVPPLEASSAGQIARRLLLAPCMAPPFIVDTGVGLGLFVHERPATTCRAVVCSSRDSSRRVDVEGGAANDGEEALPVAAAAEATEDTGCRYHRASGARCEHPLGWYEGLYVDRVDQVKLVGHQTVPDQTVI